MLYELIYASKADPELSILDVKKMVEKAAQKNAKQHLSGMLLYGQDRFLQVIEGDREIVNSLFRKIYDDKRHKTISVLSMSPIEHRHFDKWSMGLIAWEKSMRSSISGILLDMTKSTEFKPHYYEASQARDICLEMVKTENRLPINMVLVA